MILSGERPDTPPRSVLFEVYKLGSICSRRWPDCFGMAGCILMSPGAGSVCFASLSGVLDRCCCSARYKAESAKCSAYSAPRVRLSLRA